MGNISSLFRRLVRIGKRVVSWLMLSLEKTWGHMRILLL